MKVLPAVTLTTNQKRVIAKILASPTPKVAGEEISGDQNLVAARDQLAQLGAIEYVAGEASVSDKGMQLAQDANIADEGGQLTQDGEALAYTSAEGEPDKDQTRQPQEMPPPGIPAGQAPAGGPQPPITGGVGGMELSMSYAPSFKEFLLNEEKAKKKMKAKKKWKPESYQDRQDRMHREASHEDRMRKPAGMDWGTYYKSM